MEILKRLLLPDHELIHLLELLELLVIFGLVYFFLGKIIVVAWRKKNFGVFRGLGLYWAEFLFSEQDSVGRNKFLRRW